MQWQECAEKQEAGTQTVSPGCEGAWFVFAVRSRQLFSSPTDQESERKEINKKTEFILK